MTRRQVLVLSGGALLASTLPCRGFDQQAAAQVSGSPLKPSASSRTANTLYRSAFVLDANTLGSIGLLQTDNDFLAALQGIHDSGITALKSTLGAANSTFEQAVVDIALAQALIEKHPELFIKVVRYSDLERAKPENKVAVIFSFEAASMLEDKLERIAMFRQLDILVMQLTYNHKTAFGCGCLDGDTDGVTELGRNAIAKMNEVGVALDLSHANVQTTLDAIAISTRPPVITHAGCRSVYNHPRNKTDDEMKALSEKGGVMGIYMLPFLTVDTQQPKLADYMRHMIHALDVCGEDHVGIGTDSSFFKFTSQDLKDVAKDADARRKAGVGAPGEGRPPYLPDVNTPRKLEFVADSLLQHGYSARVTEKVLGLNFRRAFKDSWSA